ncbi:hypothetical protein G9U66_000308, partial [Listeria innocua]|nr:hypothetical protein [Listeria innocua]
MGKKNEFLSSVSFGEVKKILKLKDVYEVMKGDKKQSLSIELKKIIILLLGLLFPVLMVCSFAIELAGGSFIIAN